MNPSDRLYTKEHEWAEVGEDNVVVVGITDFAQKELGDVVFVELPEVGQSFQANDEIGTIESVKAVAEVYTPVSGEIVEVNESLIDEPAVLNDDPFNEGWLVKIRMDDPEEAEGLMSSDEYDAFVEGEDG